MGPTLEHPDYGVVDEALDTLNARVGAPEGHGILCGMLSTGRGVGDREWLAQLGGGAVEQLRHADSLQALYRSTQGQLDDAGFSFQPLLPDEDADLRTRTEALALWCSGFLYGLGVAGVTEATQLPGEAAEVLGDLAKIARVDFDLDDPGDEEERAFHEVLEYVRVGALLVFESLRGPRGDEAVH